MKQRLNIQIVVESKPDAQTMVDAVQAFLRTTYGRGIKTWSMVDAKWHPPGPQYAEYDDNDGET